MEDKKDILTPEEIEAMIRKLERDHPELVHSRESENQTRREQSVLDSKKCPSAVQRSFRE